MRISSGSTQKTFGGHGIVPETLTEDNYVHWKRCLRNYLVGQGLWGVVSGDEAEPDASSRKREHDEWVQKNARALHAIQLSCGTGIYSKIHEAHISARAAWYHLAEKTSPPPLSSDDQKQLVQQAKDDGTKDGQLAEKALLLPPSSSDHQQQEVQQAKDNGTKDYLKYKDLYKAIEQGKSHEVKEFLRNDREAIRARVSSHNDTALHIAILSGHSHLTKLLVEKMEKADLELINHYGATGLSLAAVCGDKKLAQLMVEKNRELVKMANEHEDGQLPVIVAALYGQKEMVHYLYKETPLSEFKSGNGTINGVKLLNCLITADIYDVALDLLKHYPKLGVTPDPSGHYALGILAQKPSAFRSGKKLSLWENLIYYFVQVHPPSFARKESNSEEHAETQASNSGAEQRIPIPNETIEDEDSHKAKTSPVQNLLKRVGWCILRGFVPEIKKIHDRKLVHREAVKLVDCTFKEIRELGKSEREKMEIEHIIYDAIKHGIFEIIERMLKLNPEIVWKKDKKGRTIFAHAIVLRQHKIFSLIYDLGARMSIMARRHDIFGNNYLHLAAKLSPPSQLERISGAALQMQRELQWYKEVESIVQPKLREEKNENNVTPETLFRDEHKQLMQDAESWMKSTAGSSMVVGTLIAAVMFTTAFTVPGGNKSDTSGIPTMLETHPGPFLVFMVSNALSMFGSCTSMLMFLGILTARYAEEDFLRSLPTKLIFGLACLFFSIVTMMASFGSALYLTLHDKISWVTIPIIVLSVIPIGLFSLCQFPLLIEMTIRTYGSGIFDKHKKKKN